MDFSPLSNFLPYFYTNCPQSLPLKNCWRQNSMKYYIKFDLYIVSVKIICSERCNGENTLRYWSISKVIWILKISFFNFFLNNRDFPNLYVVILATQTGNNNLFFTMQNGRVPSVVACWFNYELCILWCVIIYCCQRAVKLVGNVCG
jgi:hypothetical protein